MYESNVIQYYKNKIFYWSFISLINKNFLVHYRVYTVRAMYEYVKYCVYEYIWMLIYTKQSVNKQELQYTSIQYNVSL